MAKVIFEHLIYNLQEISDDVGGENGSQIYILLNDNVDKESHKVVAQAISLDIRGDFGFFLNREVYENNAEDKYEWTGNLFHINIDTESKTVCIEEIIDEEKSIYRIDLKEWEEALVDWKNFYLEQLGFLGFKSKALSHMMGVLILAYDQMDGEYWSDEIFVEAIKKCAKRYGIKKSVIYRDCKKVTGLYSIKDFYRWATKLFQTRYIDKANSLDEDILIRLSHFSTYEDLQLFMTSQLGIHII